MPQVVEVCQADQLKPGEMQLLEWEDLEIGLFNCSGTVYAIEDRCSHDNGPLIEG
ncbi:MAG: Rieske 2Fe-2S domain-containing protein, partial [Solirubrobacterales bacterium]|nr:Rieske 2Fe-2S domain-containing protein [Solirubrobacterales bacterium]